MTFKRYVVCFYHDGSPVDGLLFTHQKKAFDAVREMKKPQNFVVNKMEMIKDG